MAVFSFYLMENDIGGVDNLNLRFEIVGACRWVGRGEDGLMDGPTDLSMEKAT